MQILAKRISTIMLAACLLVVLAFGSVAWATGEWPEGTPADNTLTVGPTNKSEYAEDIAKANVVADVYLLATAEEDSVSVKYNYKLVEPFTSLSLGDESSWTSETWAKMATSAAELVKADTTPIGTVNADGKATLTLGVDGLFLVLPHGSDKTLEYGEGILDTLIADSADYRYKFSPSITAAPTKEQDEDGSIGTAIDYGNWLRAVTINLKPEQTPLYGSLKINKTVNNFEGKPATFVFHVKSIEGSPEEYDNYGSVYYTADGQTSTTLEHIKAGTIVTITESYDGSRFEKVSGPDPAGPITIEPDEVDENGDSVTKTVEVSFVNKEDGKIIEGSGIENKYTAQDSDWKPAPTPAEKSDVQTNTTK